MKRFYFTCPNCLKTVMSGTDIYENRSLNCSCGNRIVLDLNEFVLKECEGCGKNNAFPKSKGKDQSCLSCGKMLKLSFPEEILSGEDLSAFEQITEILGKGLMTKVKVEKADSLFKKISSKDELAGYGNHITNYKEFNMYDSEYNSAVRIMNETTKKLEDAIKFNVKEEIESLELKFSEIAKRFAMLGGFKNSTQYKSVCENKASECHFYIDRAESSPYSQEAAVQKLSRPAPKKQQTSRFDPVPPPPVQGSKKQSGIKGVLIGIAAALVLGAGALVVFLNQNPETDIPAGNTSVMQTSFDDDTLSEVSSDGTDMGESYSAFVQFMNEENYDLHSLKLYMDELKGYKDCDSIFESHKAGFFEHFKSTAQSYQDSKEFDIEMTLEIIEGLHYFKGYENTDELVSKTIDKNLEFADMEKDSGNYSGAADILLSFADHTDDYNDTDKLHDYFKDVADNLSGKDPETAELLLQYV